MRIRFTLFGQSTKRLEVEEGITVGELLTSKGISLNSHAVLVNGSEANEDTELFNGDRVTIAPEIEGGKN